MGCMITQHKAKASFIDRAKLPVVTNKRVRAEQEVPKLGAESEMEGSEGMKSAYKVTCNLY